MATRKKGLPPLRRPNNRRKQQVQRFTDKEIQAFAALAANIRTTLDTYRNAGTKRITRSLRAALPAGFGTLLRALHNSLQERILQSRGVRRVQLGAESGRFRQDRGKNKPLGVAVVRGGLPPDARVTPAHGGGKPAPHSNEDIQKYGVRIHCPNCDD